MNFPVDTSEGITISDEKIENKIFQLSSEILYKSFQNLNITIKFFIFGEFSILG